MLLRPRKEDGATPRLLFSLGRRDTAAAAASHPRAGLLHSASPSRPHPRQRLLLRLPLPPPQGRTFAPPPFPSLAARGRAWAQLPSQCDAATAPPHTRAPRPPRSPLARRAPSAPSRAGPAALRSAAGSRRAPPPPPPPSPRLPTAWRLTHALGRD